MGDSALNSTSEARNTSVLTAALRGAVRTVQISHFIVWRRVREEPAIPGG